MIVVLVEIRTSPNIKFFAAVFAFMLVTEIVMPIQLYLNGYLLSVVISACLPFQCYFFFLFAH